MIGYGYWGPNLARNLNEMPSIEFRSLCDSDPARLAMATDRFPKVRPVKELGELLEDRTLEAVVVATPARSHYGIAKAALEAGKHVLVEKPLAMSSREARDLIGSARSADRVLMVGHTFEYNPAVIKLKETLDAGEVGKVLHIHSTRLNLGRVQRDVNVLWSIAPHDVSILLYLLGGIPLSASARGARLLDGGVEDVVFLDLRFPGGAMAHVHVSWLDPVKVRRLVVVGSERMIVYDEAADEGKLRVHDSRASRVTGSEEDRGTPYHVKVEGAWTVPLEWREPLRAELEHFADCVRDGTAPRTDGENGLRVVRVLEAAQRSLERGGDAVEIG